MWELIAIVVLIVLLTLMTMAFLREWHEANLAQERWLAEKHVEAWARTLDLPVRGVLTASQVQPVPDLMARGRRREHESVRVKFRSPPPPVDPGPEFDEADTSDAAEDLAREAREGRG
jgi:hypothetical protein